MEKRKMKTAMPPRSVLPQENNKKAIRIRLHIPLSDIAVYQQLRKSFKIQETKTRSTQTIQKQKLSQIIHLKKKTKKPKTITSHKPHLLDLRLATRIPKALKNLKMLNKNPSLKMRKLFLLLLIHKTANFVLSVPLLFLPWK